MNRWWPPVAATRSSVTASADNDEAVLSALRQWPVSGSQMRTVASPEAVASQWLSGAMASAFTGRVWPVRVWRQWPVSGSQMCGSPQIVEGFSYAASRSGAAVFS